MQYLPVSLFHHVVPYCSQSAFARSRLNGALKEIRHWIGRLDREKDVSTRAQFLENAMCSRELSLVAKSFFYDRFRARYDNRFLMKLKQMWHKLPSDTIEMVRTRYSDDHFWILRMRPETTSAHFLTYKRPVSFKLKTF